FLKLEPIAVTTDDNLIHGCWTFLVGPHDAIYCMGSYINEISQLVDKKWVRLPNAVDPTESTKSLALEWRILSNGWVAGVSTTDLFLWNGISWTRTTLNVTDEFSGSPDLIEDFKGDLWIYGRSKQAEAYGLYKIAGDAVISFPAPSWLTHIFIQISHPKSFDGLNYFHAGAYTFNFMTETWEPSRFPVQDSGENDSLHPMMNDSNNTFTLLGNKGFFESNNDLLYWPIKSLGHDARSQGQSIERADKLLYFIDNSRPNNLSRLVRIKTSFVSSFDSSMTGSADSHATGSWNTTDGHTIVTFYDGTQLEISADRIEKKKTPENFRDALQVFALKSGGYCISRVNGYWLYEPESNKYENFALDDGGRGSLHQCTEDSSGRLWWFHFFENTLHVYDGVRPKSVPILLKDGETIKAIKALAGYSNLLIATSQRLVLLDSDDQIQRVITLNEIASDGQITALENAVMLNNQEVLVQAENPGKLKIFFTIDLLTGVSTPETEFKRIVGDFGLIRSAQWNDTTFVLMGGPKAVFMQRINRKWKELGNNIFDYQHVMINKAAKPWWFTVDTSGRLWFIASPSPYTFGRVDPDLAP
ncbi:MAG TPA: hypothetical protein VFO10_00945, partial [Oligoflexus sp.]|uniref:hypothetical protein n=1 Tax=Oligoflexus sp. TaxID=1971216 RepID=UPI002D809056